MKNLRYALWGLVGVALAGFVIMNLPPKTDDGSQAIMPVAGFNQGAHFTLTDHRGEMFNSNDRIAEGDFALIFFGFTHCPVICPTELQKFAAIMDSLPEEEAKKVHPLFITIDPDRDTVQALAEYVPQFHPAITGLTGDAATVHAVLDAWKVFYTKVEDPQFTDYTMDHSTYAYLVDHDMRIKAIYRMQNTVDQIVENIQTVITAQ